MDKWVCLEGSGTTDGLKPSARKTKGKQKWEESA
jgi:hypothetical protein